MINIFTSLFLLFTAETDAHTQKKAKDEGDQNYGSYGHFGHSWSLLLQSGGQHDGVVQIARGGEFLGGKASF